MSKRTTVEVDPIILRAIKIIAHHRKLKVKAVSDALLRFAIPHERNLFGQPTRETDRREVKKLNTSRRSKTTIH